MYLKRTPTESLRALHSVKCNKTKQKKAWLKQFGQFNKTSLEAK